LVALGIITMAVWTGCSSSTNPSAPDSTHHTDTTQHPDTASFHGAFHFSADTVVRRDSFGRITSGTVGPVAISGDGNIVAFQIAGPNSTILGAIYNANTGMLLRKFPIVYGGILELNRDGSRLHSGYGAGDVIYNTQDGSVVHDFGTDVSNRIGHMSSTGDSIVFLTWPLGHDYNIFVYTASGMLLRTYPLTSDVGHTWWFYGLTDGGRSLVIAQSNPQNIVYVLDLQTGALRDSVSVGGLAVQAFEGKVSRDGEVLAAFSGSHILQGVYTLKAETFSSPVTLTGNPQYAFSNDHQTMAAALNNSSSNPVEIIDMQSGSVLKTLWSAPGGDYAQSLAYSDDGSRLVAAFGAMGRIWVLK
jgi:WD40 repeat protein